MSMDKSRLESIKQAAIDGRCIAYNSATMLGLIGEIERATQRLCACRDCGGRGEICSGHSTHQGYNQPPEPDMDVCGTCGGDGVLGPIEDFEALAAERDQLKADVERQAVEIRELKDAIGGLKWVVGEMKGQHKNLHRSLCARFGYVHDEKCWWRDDVSLEEHIAKQLQEALAGQMHLACERDLLKAANEQLTKVIGNQTARRFVGDDDQRKIDDLVAAGIREDKRLIGQLKDENETLRTGMKGDYDLDAWLDWTKEKGLLKAEVASRMRQVETLTDEHASAIYLHAQIQRAAGELPGAWSIQVVVEKDAGYVQLFDDDGNEVEFDGQGDLGEQVSDALDIALGKGEQL